MRDGSRTESVRRPSVDEALDVMGFDAGDGSTPEVGEDVFVQDPVTTATSTWSLCRLCAFPFFDVYGELGLAAAVVEAGAPIFVRDDHRLERGGFTFRVENLGDLTSEFVAPLHLV